MIGFRSQYKQKRSDEQQYPTILHFRINSERLYETTMLPCIVLALLLVQDAIAGGNPDCVVHLGGGRFQVWHMKNVSLASILDERISAVMLVQLIFCSDAGTCDLYSFIPWTPPKILIDLYILVKDKKFGQPNF